MSGVCGIWAPRNDQALVSSTVQRGLDAMIHRGRDGFSLYPGHDFVLGHCLFDTGCNGMSVNEDGYAISFDGRLDNRSDLEAALRRDGAEGSLDLERLHDKNLLLLAFARFGTTLPGILRGDFAIAIWDPGTESLFLCRDQLGVRPLFFRWLDGALHFASEIKALQAMGPGGRLPLRTAALNGFVDGELDENDPEKTFYLDIYRLLPGHFATVGAAGMAIERYWELDPDLPHARPDTNAQFRDLLGQAINRRLRTMLPVGALLSGGLDSSAIVSMIGARATAVNPANVEVFSLVFPDMPEGDEAPYIDAVSDAYAMPAIKFDGSESSALADCDAIIAEQDHAPMAPNTATFRHFLHRLAGQGQARVILHGHGGDEVVSNGTGYFRQLAESGSWLRLWRSLGEMEEAVGPRAPHFRSLVLGHGLRAWRRLVGQWASRYRGRRDTVHFAPDGSYRPFEQIAHLRALTAPQFAYALEVIDHEAAFAGVELRMPFLDLDLLSFCVTVRGEEKLAGGYVRALQRNGLAGILPEKVALRRDKFDFLGNLRRSLVQDHQALVNEALYAEAEELTPFADVDALRAGWRQMRNGDEVDGRAVMRIWRAVMLSRWLQLDRGRPETGDLSDLMAAE